MSILGEKLMDKNIIKKYKKLTKSSLGILSVVGGMVISFFAGIAGIIMFDSPVMLILSVAVIVGVPVLCFKLYFAFSKRKDKKIEELRKMIFDNVNTADEVLKLGKENDIDLFSIAMEVRCFKELGLNGVPEWAARDGVLPPLK